MRKATTLLELLVVLAIIGVLAALLVPAIQRVRHLALRTESLNNLRQIAVATHNYAQAHGSKLPALGVFDTTFVAILPYLEQSGQYETFHGKRSGELMRRYVPAYLNPLDPSTMPFPEMLVVGYPVSSYAANAQLFARPASFSHSFVDGTSNTILLTEHYGWNCNGFLFNFAVGSGSRRIVGVEPFSSGQGRATFADGGPNVDAGFNSEDFYPITNGKPPISSAEGNVTFQLLPTIRDCDPRLPNASSPAGLQVAQADGCVRIIAPSVAPRVFWAAVTPGGGELNPLD